VKERGKEKFLTLHVCPISGDVGTKIFLANGSLLGPYTSKISDSQILRGVEEKCLKNFLFFSGVKCAVKQISEIVSQINLLFRLDC